MDEQARLEIAERALERIAGVAKGLMLLPPDSDASEMYQSVADAALARMSR